MDFIQEVQVKSSGFEAEYGGALGGVVNVDPEARQSNEWHGSVFTYYKADALQCRPESDADQESAVRGQRSRSPDSDQPVEYYQPIKDHYRDSPIRASTLGGYVVKDRLWAFVSALRTSTTRAHREFRGFVGRPATVPSQTS